MRVLVLLVVLASLAGAQPGEGGSYSLEQPLAAQRELSPGLVGDLTPPTGAALGLPRGVGPVRVEVGASGVPGAVRLDAPGVRVEGRAAAVLGRLAAGETGAALEADLAELPGAELEAEIRRLPWWDEARHGLRDRLALVLVERGEWDVSQPASLPRDLALAAAEALRRRVDRRCVGVYEHLLQQYAWQPAEGWVPEVYGLASYWRAVGEVDAALTTWRDGMRFTTTPEVRADFQGEMSRDLWYAGRLADASAARAIAIGLAAACGEQRLASILVLDGVRQALQVDDETLARQLVDDTLEVLTDPSARLTARAGLVEVELHMGDWQQAQATYEALRQEGAGAASLTETAQVAVQIAGARLSPLQPGPIRSSTTHIELFSHSPHFRFAKFVIQAPAGVEYVVATAAPWLACSLSEGQRPVAFGLERTVLVSLVEEGIIDGQAIIEVREVGAAEPALTVEVICHGVPRARD